MAKSKKSRKERKNKSNSLYTKNGNLKSPEILQLFKTSWKTGEWNQALHAYRAWCNRTDKKRDPQIEGEILFRLSSSCFCKNQYSLAIGFLEDAERVDSENRDRYLFCKGISLARNGQASESERIFAERNNIYHKDIISFFSGKERQLPEEIDHDPAFQQDFIHQFWLNLNNQEEASTSSTAINCLKDAYSLFTTGKDPDSRLKLLEKKTGFKDIAIYLKLLMAIYNRSNIKIRNLLKKNPDVYSSGSSDSLIEFHLQFLLEEKNYREILIINELIKDFKTTPDTMSAARDTALFYLGLKEVEQDQLEKAYDFYRNIEKNQTPAVLHNSALIHQNLERYNEANECWITLCRKNKKPRRSDSESLRISYTVMLKYIAENYRKADLPDKALTFFKEVLSYDKGDREALEALYQIFSEKENTHSACSYAKQLFEIDKNNDEYLFNYTSELMELNQLKKITDLYEDAYERNPNNNLYNKVLASCYIKHAHEIKNTNINETKSLIKKIKSLVDTESYRLTYLEGYILHKEGEKREAIKKVNRAVDMVEEHMEEFDLGCTLYDDGFMKQAVILFKEIVECGCSTSVWLFESIIKFLVERGDRELTLILCKIAEDTMDWDNYAIADMLYDLKIAPWALEYSTKLIRQNNVDEEDRFLHLLILNAIGNSKDTLNYTRKLLIEAENNDKEDDAYTFKQLIKQIKNKGKFKPVYE